MGTGAECKVTVRTARKIESIRSMKLIRIPICSSNAECQIRTGLEHDVAADDALHDEPVAQLVGTLVAQEFLDRTADQVGRAPQLQQSLTIIEQSVEAVSDEIGRRLVTCVQKEDAVVEQLRLGHLAFAQQAGQYVRIITGVPTSIGYQET